MFFSPHDWTNKLFSEKNKVPVDMIPDICLIQEVLPVFPPIVSILSTDLSPQAAYQIIFKIPSARISHDPPSIPQF